MTKTALVVIDVQNDFCEGGSLAVTGGALLARKISDHLQAYRSAYDLTVATRDFHSPHSTNGGHFAAEGHSPDYTDTWPAHCVAGTPGAEYHQNLDTTLIDAHVTKGHEAPAYSGFQGSTDTGASLADLLRSAGITNVHVVGIATDYCVKATALDAIREGFTTHVLTDLIAAVAPETGEAAEQLMADAGATVRVSTDILAVR